MPLPPLLGNPGTNRLMTSPVTRLSPAVMYRPLAPTPALEPSISMIGVPAKPGCVVPSITTGPTIVGSAESGTIDFCPEPITNRIVSVPAFALAALIASRSVQLAALHTPSSVSAVEFTV